MLLALSLALAIRSIGRRHFPPEIEGAAALITAGYRDRAHQEIAYLFDCCIMVMRYCKGNRKKVTPDTTGFGCFRSEM